MICACGAVASSCNKSPSPMAISQHHKPRRQLLDSFRLSLFWSGEALLFRNGLFLALLYCQLPRGSMVPSSPCHPPAYYSTTAYSWWIPRLLFLPYSNRLSEPHPGVVGPSLKFTVCKLKPTICSWRSTGQGKSRVSYRTARSAIQPTLWGRRFRQDIVLIHTPY